MGLELEAFSLEKALNPKHTKTANQGWHSSSNCICHELGRCTWFLRTWHSRVRDEAELCTHMKGCKCRGHFSCALAASSERLRLQVLIAWMSINRASPTGTPVRSCAHRLAKRIKDRISLLLIFLGRLRLSKERPEQLYV